MKVSIFFFSEQNTYVTVENKSNPGLSRAQTMRHLSELASRQMRFYGCVNTGTLFETLPDPLLYSEKVF